MNFNRLLLFKNIGEARYTMEASHSPIFSVVRTTGYTSVVTRIDTMGFSTVLKLHSPITASCKQYKVKYRMNPDGVLRLHYPSCQAMYWCRLLVQE